MSSHSISRLNRKQKNKNKNKKEQKSKKKKKKKHQEITTTKIPKKKNKWIREIEDVGMI